MLFIVLPVMIFIALMAFFVTYFNKFRKSTKVAAVVNNIIMPVEEPQRADVTANDRTLPPEEMKEQYEI